jgi:hypothetical protein
MADLQDTTSDILSDQPAVLSDDPANYTSISVGSPPRSEGLRYRENPISRESSESVETGERPKPPEPAVEEGFQPKSEEVVDILPLPASHGRVIDLRNSATPSVGLKDAVHSITAYADEKEEIFIEKVKEEHGSVKS